MQINIKAIWQTGIGFSYGEPVPQVFPPEAEDFLDSAGYDGVRGGQRAGGEPVGFSFCGKRAGDFLFALSPAQSHWLPHQARFILSALLTGRFLINAPLYYPERERMY